MNCLESCALAEYLKILRVSQVAINKPGTDAEAVHGIVYLCCQAKEKTYATVAKY